MCDMEFNVVFIRLILIDTNASDEDTQTFLYKVTREAGDNEVAPHGDGHCSKGALKYEHELQRVVRDQGWHDEFTVWYQEEIDTSVSQPGYPAYQLHYTRTLWKFLNERRPGHILLSLDDEVRCLVVASF